MSEKQITVLLLSPETMNRPSYYAQWILPGTTQRVTRSLRTGDENAAESKRQTLEYELNHGLHVEPQKLTWQDFRRLYTEEHLAARRKGTRSAARTVLDRFTEEIHPRGVADIDERMLSRYFGLLRSAGLRPASLAKHSAYLRTALRWAHRQGLIRKCPNFEKVKQPKKVRIKIIKSDQFADFLRAMPDDHWRLLANLAWFTGLRRTELYELQWQESDRACWIDLEGKRIWIPAEACKADSDSWLPIHPDLLPHLESIPDRKGKVIRLHQSPQELSRHFARFARNAGFAITLHDLRRSFGSRYAQVVPAQVLQRLMRHSSIVTTLRYYIDLDDGLSDAIGKA